MQDQKIPRDRDHRLPRRRQDEPHPPRAGGPRTGGASRSSSTSSATSGIDRDVLQGCGRRSLRRGRHRRARQRLHLLHRGRRLCAGDRGRCSPREPAPEHILIETSGLALPKPLVAAFNWPEIRTRLTVDGVVAVVDGPGPGRRAASPTTRTRSRPSARPTRRWITNRRWPKSSKTRSAAPTW